MKFLEFLKREKKWLTVDSCNIKEELYTYNGYKCSSEVVDIDIDEDWDDFIFCANLKVGIDWESSHTPSTYYDPEESSIEFESEILEITEPYIEIWDEASEEMVEYEISKDELEKVKDYFNDKNIEIL